MSDGLVEGVGRDVPEVVVASFGRDPWPPPLLRCMIGWWLR